VQETEKKGNSFLIQLSESAKKCMCKNC